MTRIDSVNTLRISSSFYDQAFVWNAKKATDNIVNRRVTLEEAAGVFFDLFVRSQDASDNDQKREAAIRYSEHYRLPTIVHLQDDGDRIRIISAWLVSAEERKRYEEAN